MSYRRWFTPRNTEGLEAADLAILNRAGRVMANRHGRDGALDRDDLTALRQTYAAGMSAVDPVRRIESLAALLP
jgi:hypothetical protein